MAENAAASNFRSPVLADPILMPPAIGGGGGEFGISSSLGSGVILRTPAGNVRSLAPPPLPISPNTQYSGGMGAYGGYGNSLGTYGGYGSSYGSGYGLGGYGGYYGGHSSYNRFGMTGTTNPMDPENIFIQLAEASSRPAFQSIESLVMAVGNIATMLDSTFVALTSSFRAVLGVAANFGRLRGVFAQFWSAFALFRGITWIYRKILFVLRISDLDPSSKSLDKAFTDAINESSTQQGAPNLPRKGLSPWPVITFLSFIFTAPYLIMKLLGRVADTAQKEARNPRKWIQPIDSVAIYDFQARNPSELTICIGQRIVIAPKEIQNTLALLNTGWALATIDGQTTGIIPINYVKSPRQMNQDQMSKQNLDTHINNTPLKVPIAEMDLSKPDLKNSLTSSFADPSTQTQVASNIPDFDIAPQPAGPSNILNEV